MERARVKLKLCKNPFLLCSKLAAGAASATPPWEAKRASGRPWGEESVAALRDRYSVAVARKYCESGGPAIIGPSTAKLCRNLGEFR